jgi:hypothetical protein
MKKRTKLALCGIVLANLISLNLALRHEKQAQFQKFEDAFQDAIVKHADDNNDGRIDDYELTRFRSGFHKKIDHHFDSITDRRVYSKGPNIDKKIPVCELYQALGEYCAESKRK